MTKINFQETPVTNNISDEIMWKIDSKDLLCDLKTIMKDFYVATFRENDNELCLSFNNGQKFIITAKEIM